MRSFKEDENGAREEPQQTAEIRGVAQAFYVGCWVRVEQSQPNSRNVLGLDPRPRQKKVLFSKRPKRLS